MNAVEKPKIYIETYGCQMNVLDSELVRDQFEALGYGFVERADEAGVVFLNTCSVRDLSEQKVWSKLGRLGIAKRNEQPNLVIGVLGCMAEKEGPHIIKRMPQVDILCGPSNLDQLPRLVENAVLNKKSAVALAGHNSRRTKTLEAAVDGVETLDLSRAFSPYRAKAQAYVRITRGCNKFCSFCVVPYTRGPEVHRPPDNIVEEIERLVDSGVREVTLIGQTVNHYHFEDGGKSTSFADLLHQVHERVPALPRLRFITSYPRSFTDDALDVMAQSERICRYLHIPAQSGSNRLLKLMNRGYTVEEYLDLIDRARSRMPDIRLAGDMIVGFPSETDEDHEASVALMRTARYKSCFVFKYSPRSGTVADKRLEDDIPEGVKKARNLELLQVQSEVGLAQNESRVGQVMDVLVEGQSKLRKNAHGPADLIQLGGIEPKEQAPSSDRVRLIGRTRGDEIVAFDGHPDWVGTTVQVRAVNATDLTILGVAASEGLRSAS